MKWVAPEYYLHFRCIAGACRHTCCAGWEIDVDEESRERYRAVPGELGARLASAIEDTEEGAHFRLGEGERCPFLNGEGLCDLILGLGEDSLCQVCADHPRYRNFLSDRTEIGLGLCCEAAARLILSQAAPVRLVELEHDGAEDELWPEDAEVLAVRDRLIELAQDRTRPVAERAAAVCRELGVETVLTRPLAVWAAFCRTLEQLNPAWQDELALLDKHVPLTGMEWELPLEQLLVYFLYRHVTGAAEDGDLAGRTAFAAASWLVVQGICGAHAACGPFTLEDMAEAARMYSSEIEYSDENVQRIISFALEK